MFIYLANAIDLRITDDFMSTFRDGLITNLIEYRHIVFFPQNAFCLKNEALKINDIQKLIGINNRALLSADLVIFLWDGSPSWGLPQELEMIVKYNREFIFVDMSGLPSLPIYLQSLLQGTKTDLTNPLTPRILKSIITQAERMDIEVISYYYIKEIKTNESKS